MKTDPPGSPVSAWEEAVTIPTYPTPAPDLHPMFLEKRVNQGASGKVYPNPLMDHIPQANKTDHVYQAVYLENEFLQLMILPQLGGRIFGALDKTNGYNFLYRQHVIKPALIGLFGAWISGGMEFNWPQHHRPSTFMQVDHLIEEHPDGSRTVWLSEHDPMQRMKGMVGVCLHPGKALFETKVRLYNRTPFPQTFLWWENAAVHINEQYQIFFPPDVTHVTFHSKQDMAHFPIARTVYCGVDFTQGVDISWHKNSPHSTSYFAYDSRFDFFGGYDHGRQAGVVHVADHLISPGKKMFSWGTSDFARTWEGNLTDADGPYAELMAGVYTDNQPDFSWLQPYETRTFSQYWYPIQQIGTAKAANCQAAANLEIDGKQAAIGVYTTEVFRKARVILKSAGQSLLEQEVDLGPGAAFLAKAELPAGVPESDLLLQVLSENGTELLRYAPEPRVEKPLPDTARRPAAPKEIQTLEELYLTGLHVEQYRHPTLDPEAYWQEALKREPGDARNNNAMGLWLLRRGEYARAEQHFQAAIRTLTRLNPNPYDGEPCYHLGWALKLQHRLDEAYAAFFKAAWSYAWSAASYYSIAEIDCLREDFTSALEHIDHSLATNGVNSKARNLKTAVLRRLGHYGEAEALARQTIEMDPLDFWSRHELALLRHAQGNPAEAERLQRELSALMNGNAQTWLDIAYDYTSAGLWDEAAAFLKSQIPGQGEAEAVYPMVFYTLGAIALEMGDEEQARADFNQAAQIPPDYCFPVRLEEMEVLKKALSVNPQDGRAAYYLGNLLYDKKQYPEAIRQWESASQYEPGFSIPWRNLGLAYYNIQRDLAKARQCYLRALECNPGNARLLYENDLLQMRLGAPPAERLSRLEQRLDTLDRYDALYLERISLLNQLGQPEKALDLLLSHHFSPWEGGEGAIAYQYSLAHMLIGQSALIDGDGKQAFRHYEAALNFPQNLGAGTWHPVTSLPCQFYAGVALENAGDVERAKEYFQKVLNTKAGSWTLMFLPSLPYYQALALRKTGQEAEARQKLQELLENSTREAESGFATSAPNFLPFEDDPEKERQIRLKYLIGLAHMGLGQLSEAKQAFEEVLALDPNHMEAQMELRWLGGKFA